jgi:hypothetical protein
MGMKRILMELCLGLAWLLTVGCAKEMCREKTNGSVATLSLKVDCPFQSKSSIIVDESRVRDLNVWVFSSSGVLAESYYFEDLSIHGSGSVSFDSSAGGHSSLIVIGNAGRKLQAPPVESEEASFRMDYPPGTPGTVLMVGEGALTMTSTGLRSDVSLKRDMCRIALKTGLSSSLAAGGGVLGGNVKIREVRFVNSPASFSILPGAAWDSASLFKATSNTVFQTGDCLSAADLATLQAGGTVYLYSLPNYTDVDYSDRPLPSTLYATYIEMTVDYEASGNISEGSAVCRFYANDGNKIGLQGGCSYTCMVTLSNDGASNTWRKDDFRFEIPSAFTAGEAKEVTLHSRTHVGTDVSFSLSKTPGVSSTGTFRIGEKVYGDYLSGVKVAALSAGSDTLYCFDSMGKLMGSVPLEASFPSICVSDKELDVLGDMVNLDIQGLSAVYSARESDALFGSLYSIASMEALEPVSGLYGQDFIYADTSGERLYVNKIQWNRSGSSHDWTEAVGKTIPYRVTLSCGITADFNVSITNQVMGPLEGSVYFGEAFDMRMVEDPLPAVAELDNHNTITAVITAGIPREFCKSRQEREADGWMTFFGGARLEGGNDADGYIREYSINLIRWELPKEAVRMEYGAAVPLFIGKRNPHCNEYVKARVGYYASTCYNPIGVEVLVEVVNAGGLVTCLCFRPHDTSVVLDVSEGAFVYQGRDGGNLFSGNTGIGSSGYAVMTDGSYLETNWNGDLTSLPEFNENNGAFYSSSDFIYDVVSPYNGNAFGAKNGRHLALYYYAPYTYQGGHAEIADENGHVSHKGNVSVEKWSVSSKAFFDWDDS